MWRILVTLLVSVGCIRTGLPETFSEGVVTSNGMVPRPWVVVAEESDEVGATLGHQYVLGIIPVTSLFYPYGEQALATEVTLRGLSQQGYVPIVAKDASVVSISSVLHPAGISRTTLEDSSLNVYDAFFFRWLSAATALKVEALTVDRQRTSVSRTIPRAVHEHEFRKFGPAPLLSILFERGIQQAVAESIPAIRRRKYPRVSTGQMPTFVMMPELRLPQPAVRKLLDLVANAYGYSVSFTAGQLSRILQRGFVQGIRSDNVAATMLTQSVSMLALLRAPALLLNASILEVTPMVPTGWADEGRVRVLASVKLQRAMPRGSVQTLFSADCTTEVPWDIDAEAGFVRSLEQATKQISTAFMEGTCAEVQSTDEAH